MVKKMQVPFHPLVTRWFAETYGEPTDVQAPAWQAISRGGHVLMTAPTGSGKTLAAFLWALDQLIAGRWSTGCTRILYISPLKALNNDIRRNLKGPLAALRELFRGQGLAFPDIRVMTRSGDTTPSERRRMLRNPPEILITTPESLNLMLSSANARSTLTTVQTVILDEIHAIAGSRRGTYLITAVERLARLSGEFQRIALSATIRPLETAARFVGGFRQQGNGPAPDYVERPVSIVSTPTPKQYDLAIRQPPEPEEAQDPRDYWIAYADCIKTHVQANQATLVFTNSRRLCEKLTYLMNQDEPELLAYAHHGSLSREIRTVVERNLKAGKLKAIVATGSLELGIDIGALDEVVLVQSPTSAAEAMQRVGRAGHQVGARSRGTFYPSHAMDIVSAAVLVEAVGQGHIEEAHPVAAPLDVLAQIMVSLCAFETWTPEDLYHFIRTAYPYRHLSRRQFDLVVDLLEGRFATARIRELRPRISHDRLDRTLKTKRGALLALYSSGGVIPDRGYYALRNDRTGARIGELDEEFVWEARIGQVFTLGTQNWRVRKITHNDVLVTPAPAGATSPPFWRAEENSRGFYLSERIGTFMEAAQDGLETAAFEQTLRQQCQMDVHSIKRLTGFLRRQQEHTGCALPHRHHVVVEFTTLGPGGAAGNQVVWHTLWGGRVNRPLAVALEAAWEERFGKAPQVFASNDAISFVLSDEITADDLLALVTAGRVETLLHRRLAHTGFFGARFRECAGRALLLPRRQINRRMPLWLSRLRARKLLDEVGAYEDFPIVAETWRTCLQDAFDLPALKQVLGELEAGAISRSVAHTAFPSPMAQNSAWQPVNTAMYQTDQPAQQGAGLTPDLLYEVSLAPGLRPRVAPELVQKFEATRQRLAPGYAPDNPEDLLDWAKERIAIPVDEWNALLASIEQHQEIVPHHLTSPLEEKLVFCHAGRENSEETLILARELLPRWMEAMDAQVAGHRFQLLSGRGIDQHKVSPSADDNGAAILVAEWLRYYGPRPVTFVGKTLGIPENSLIAILEELAENNIVILGALVKGSDEREVCDRENFEILLRMARKQAAPAMRTLPAEQLALFLAHVQGLTRPGNCLDDLAVQIHALLGWPAPADLWESDLLPARMTVYQTDWLDRLAAEGGLRWIGCGKKRICLCFESDRDLIETETGAGKVTAEEEADDAGSIFPDPHARYPFSALLAHTGLNAGDLNQRLWEDVWRGRAANDTFGALRRGIAGRFKLPEGQSRTEGAFTGRRTGRRRPSFREWRGRQPSMGNWYCLTRSDDTGDPLDAEERNKERARLVLDRYGIVFRELLERELPAFGWTVLFRSLRLMELSGEVLTGQFFHGIQGPQFVSPRSYRLLGDELPHDVIFWLNAADPASVCGLGLQGLPGSLPRRLATNHLVFHGHSLLVVSRQNGRHLDIRIPADDNRLRDCLAFLTHLLTRPVNPLRRIKVEAINDQPASNREDYLTVLSDVFETVLEPKVVSLYRKHL